ncbi:ubiquitin carboxyl-terminal hydrolase 34-like isoform X1 [Rhopilema esculentum]|uniref:ubiquitin carboxyl-terminal hydrolase 34-like isoform X1 n=1 Tax=Rhopilema esculentum TaxID=499914 RepID=UPI0031CE5CBB
MDPDCCSVLYELAEKCNKEGEQFEDDDWIRFADFTLNSRQCKCQSPEEIVEENIEKLTNLYIKFCIELINKVSNGLLKQRGNSGILGELDQFFQALVKLFQVHFYLTDRGKKLQGLLSVKHSFVWTYCDIANEEAPAQMLENVAFFCEHGGLDAIKDCFHSDESSMPISLASCLISIIAQLRVWFSRDAIRKFIKSIAAPVLRYLCSLSEEEIRMPNTRAMADLMLSTIKVDSENESRLERNSLELSFTYFMSSTLTVRMEGLNQITNQIHNLIEMSQNDNFGDVDSLCQELAKWLIEREMIEHLFGPNHHIELLKQSQFLLNFLAQERHLKPKHLECVWNAAQLKHTGKFVLELLISLTKHMDLKSIQYLLSLVGKLAVGSHTKQTLLLASLLTRRVWSATLAGVAAKRELEKEPKADTLQVKKRVDVSPTGSESPTASVSSDGSTDEEVANIHASNIADGENQGDDSRRLEMRMSNTELQGLPNDNLLEVSPRDFDDSNDLLPSSSFQNEQVEGDYDEDEINYMNVSPVSEREQESEESEDDDVSLANCLERGQQAKSPLREKEELNAECLCLEGKTLLWDLLQDGNVEELGDGMVQEVQKLLWQLVCFTGNKNVVMAFIKGCLDNIEMNRSVVISFQILPKILNGYPRKNSSESHWLLDWAVKELRMMDTFFSNLKEYVAAWQISLQTGNDSIPGHQREQQILARLEFLTALYSNDLSPDHFRLTIDQVDCLWSCLITKIPDGFHYLLLSWLLKQTNNKELHALGLDNYKHIFMNKLPEVNPETITFTGLGLFQQLFSLTRLSNASPFAQDSQNEEIPGIDYLWRIVLNAQKDQVADEAMAYLNYLYIQIGNGSMEKEKEFLDTCMVYLRKSMEQMSDRREESLRTIQQILTILKSHLDAYWKRFAYHVHLWQLDGHNFEGHQPNVRSHGKDQVVRIICQPAGISEKVSFRLSSHDLLAKLRAEVTHWCVKLQKEQEEKGQPQLTPPLQPPFRLISHGHELTPDLDQKALGELGMKNQQLVFVSVSHPRKDRTSSGSQVPASLQRSPDMEASPMVQLLREENFSLFFRLLDVLHKAWKTGPAFDDSDTQNTAGEREMGKIDRIKSDDNIARKLSSDDLVHSLWELLMILPTNLEIKQILESTDADEKNMIVPKWTQLVNTESTFKLLYILHIIDSMSTHDYDVLQGSSQDEASTDSDSSSSENEQTVATSAEPLGWVKKFIKYGGLKSLYDRLLSESLSVDKLSDHWTLDCVGYLLKLLTRFGCVSLSREEKEEHAEREGKRRRMDIKQKRHVFRARYKSIDGDNIVVIQAFNQPLLDLIKEEQLLEKLISLLCDVSENRNCYAAGTQDVHAAVVYHCLSLLVCWTYMDNRVKSSLVHHPRFEILLKRLVFESPQKSVRSEASRGIYKMCISGDSNLLHDVLNILLRNLPDLVASHESLRMRFPSSKSATLSYKDYFWLLSRLIDKIDRCLPEPSHVNLEEAVQMVANFIATHTITKETNPTSDYCLIGLLQTCSALLRHEPEFKYGAEGRRLLHKVFSDCLFRLPSKGDKSDEFVRPTCETKSARAAAFDLLLKLAYGSEANYKELQTLFFQHHTVDGKSGSHTSYGWNYWPHELERSSAGYVGLVNLGATCYMASCVQQLFMIPKARAALLQVESSDKMKFPTILKELQRMFTYLQESYRKAYNPRSFCKTYTMDKQPLNTGEQKDMAEFFTDLISKLEEMDDNLKYTMRELFCGVITNNVVSLDCKHVSKREEEFYSVRCTVADMKNLYESLDEETVKDVLEGDNKYTCSQCQEKVRAEKRACFKKLPKVLCFNTMRYTFNMVTMMKEKVNTHFSFPMKLNMAPYAEEYLMQNKEQDPDDDPRYWYNLAGVVVHTGTADGGHYYSFIRDRYSKSGNWYLFNDAEVKPFDPSQIAAECFGGEMMTKTYDAVTEKYMDVSFEKTHSAYMLFYEHSSMSEEEQPPKQVRLRQELQNWIWEDNMQFLRDKLVYDLSYFNFMWQFCHSVPKSINTSASVMYFSIKLATSFLLETFFHSREKPHMKNWMEVLLGGLEKCHAACEWLLDTMGGDDWWLQQMFIKCPAQPLRQMFGQLCLHAIKIIRPSQINEYCQISEDDSDSNDDGEFGSGSPITRFIKTNLTLLEDNIRSHCKNLGELFHFIYQFVSLGQEECTFMLNIDAISSIVHFYMGLKTSEVADMTNDDDDDLDMDEEDILSIFPEERYNPSALEKMISTIAVLLDEARDDGRLSLSENDYHALTGEKDFPFIFQITKDGINLKQTAHIIFSLSQYDIEMAERILQMLVTAIQKLPAEQIQNFFKLLSLLTEHDSVPNRGLPSFSNLILPKMAQVAEQNPGLYIDWLTSQVPRNKTAHQWTLQNLDLWVERYLIADNNPRIRNGAAFLLVSLVPNPHFPQAFRARSFAQPQKEWKMSAETKLVLHKIYIYLLDLLKNLRKYADASQHGTTKLVSYFSVLNYSLVSQEEKLMFTPYSADLWQLFYPKMTEPDIAVHFNKQALLTFWFHVCISCEENIRFITETPEVFQNIAYNYILSNDEPEVIAFNRNALPVYYGLLRVACQYSPEFCQQLASHRNMTWAFKHLTPRINQYPQAVEELFNLLGLFTSNRQSDENPELVNAFRAKAVALFSTSIDGQSAWTTLISAYKVLLQSEEELLIVATNNGLTTLSEALFTLFVMYYEATACNVEDDIAEVLHILLNVMNCCMKHRDRQGKALEIKRSLFSWKERREVMQKLASMLNSYSPRKIRHSCTDLLTAFLILYNEDTIETLAPIIYQSHVSIGNQQNPPVPGQFFPRRGNKPLPRKLSIAPRIPELNMVLHPVYIEAQKGIDESYDQSLVEYFSDYHHFVDKLCRYALNADQVPRVIIEISCILGVEAIPLRLHLFPKLWLEVKNKSQENPRFRGCLEKLVQCDPFIEYVDTILAEERESLSNPSVFSFMLQFLPKIHMRILSGQKQGLVNTVVSKVIADCSMLNDDGDEELVKTAHRTNGDLRALSLLFAVSSPKELTVGTLLTSSLEKLSDTCQVYKEKQCKQGEDVQIETTPAQTGDADAEEDAKEVSDAEASGSSKGGSSPGVEAVHGENKDQGDSNTKESKQGPILEPPTKKQKRGDSVEVVEQKNAGDAEYCDKNEGENSSKGEDTTVFKTDGGSDDDNNLNEDSSDSISSLSSSDSEKAEQMDRDSRRQSGEFSKPLQQPVQTTIIDMLRKSSNELLSSLQRYYDSK